MEDQAAAVLLDTRQPRLAVTHVQVGTRIDRRMRPALLPARPGVDLVVLVGDDEVAVRGGFADRAEVAFPCREVPGREEIDARLRLRRHRPGRRVHGGQRHQPDAHAPDVAVRRGHRLAHGPPRARMGHPPPAHLLQRRHDPRIPVVPRVVVRKRDHRHADLVQVVEHLGSGAVEVDVVAGGRAVATGPRDRDFQVGEDGVGGREDRCDGGEGGVEETARIVLDEGLADDGKGDGGGGGRGRGAGVRGRTTGDEGGCDDGRDQRELASHCCGGGGCDVCLSATSRS